MVKSQRVFGQQSGRTVTEVRNLVCSWPVERPAPQTRLSVAFEGVCYRSGAKFILEIPAKVDSFLLSAAYRLPTEPRTDSSSFAGS